MADLNVSATSAFALDSHSACDVRTVELSIEDDFLVFDGHVLVQYVQLGPMTRSSAGIVTQTRTAYPVPHAITRKVQDRDVRINEGWLRVGDRYFELWKKDLPIEPRIGDIIIHLGVEWRVLGYGSPTLRTRWQMVCRK